MLRPISYPEQAREVVRHLIFNGTYQPGQKLKEVELSKVLGISRSPIREALQTLANEGIVDLIPNRGAFVVSCDLGDVEELFAVREALEALGVRLAVERAKPSELSELQKQLEDTSAILENDEYLPYPRDLDFHQQLFKLARNRKLEDTAAEVNLQLQLARLRSSSRPGRASQACREHFTILEALKERDTEKAEQAMKKHIHSAMESMTSLLAARNAEAS